MHQLQADTAYPDPTPPGPKAQTQPWTLEETGASRKESAGIPGVTDSKKKKRKKKNEKQ